MNNYNEANNFVNNDLFWVCSVSALLVYHYSIVYYNVLILSIL